MKTKRRKTDNGHFTAVFNLRLRVEVLADLRQQAEAEQRTMTNLAAMMIREGLEKRANASE